MSRFSFDSSRDAIHIILRKESKNVRGIEFRFYVMKLTFLFCAFEGKTFKGAFGMEHMLFPIAFSETKAYPFLDLFRKERRTF